MNEATKKLLPSMTDIMLIVGISSLSTGIAVQWGWPVACEVVGVIVISLALFAKFRGQN